MSSYQADGYLLGRFADSPTHRILLAALAEIRTGTLRPDFYFMGKPGRRDVKPRAFEYSDAIIDILHENNIVEFVGRAVGHPVTLVNVAIVDSLPPGYFTNWHADNFVPAVHKVIFYPAFGAPPSKRIDVLAGHIKPFGAGGWRERLSVNERVIRVESIVARHRVRSISSSDHEFLLVNTQTLHRTHKVTAGGDLRLLYSFRAPFTSVEDRKRYLSRSVGTLDDQLALEEQFRSREPHHA
jgi:hypothetical protein